MTESESVALPFGDSPLFATSVTISQSFPNCKHFLKKRNNFFAASEILAFKGKTMYDKEGRASGRQMLENMRRTQMTKKEFAELTNGKILYLDGATGCQSV